MNNKNFLGSLTFLALTAICCIFLACSKDDPAPEKNVNTSNVPANLVGVWGGEKVDGRTGNRRTLTVTFKSDGTGELTFHSNVYYRYAVFNHTYSGSTINCNGVIAGEDGVTNQNWNQSFEYHESYLTPIGSYSDIQLTKGANYGNI